MRPVRCGGAEASFRKETTEKSKYGGGSSLIAVEEGHEPRVVAGRPLVGQA